MNQTQFLAKNDALSLENFNQLTTLVSEKLSFTQSLLDLGNQGKFESATRLIENGQGIKLTDQIKTIVSDMKSNEFDLLQKRKALERESGQSLLRILVISFLVGFLFCVVAAVYFNSQFREKQRTNQLLQDSEHRYRSLAESANDSFITADSSGKIVTANPFSEILFGYRQDEMIGQPLSLVFSEKFVEESGGRPFEKFLELTRPAQGVNVFELTARKKDQSEFPVEVSVASWKTREGDFYTTITRDITERKFFTKMLMKNEHRLFQFLEAVPVGVFVLDWSGKPYYANQAAKVLFGKTLDPHVTPEQLAGYYGLYSSETNQPYPSTKMPLARALSGEKSSVEDMEIRKPGVSVPLQVWGVPIQDDLGRVKYSVGVFLDITERVQSLKALQEREEFFRTLFDENPVEMMLAFPDSTIVNVNQALCKTMGYTHHELEGHSFLEFIHPDYVSLDESLNKQLMDNLIPKYQIEKRYITKTGQEIWCKTSASAIRDANGAPLFRLAIVENIHEQKLAEIALKESEEKFRRVFEESPLGMVFADEKGNLQDVNESFARMLGYSREELVQTNIFGLTHPDDLSISRSIPQKQEGSGSRIIEKRYMTKGNKTIWAQVTPLVMEDKARKSTSILSIIENITERKEAEMGLRESEERFRTLAESANESIISTDSQGRVIYCNKATERLFGYSREQLSLKPMFMLMSEQTVREYRSLVQNYLASGDATIPGRTVEWTVRHKDGREFPAEVSYFSWKPPQGLFFTSLVRDITERKQIDDMKRDVISIVSHQLKTPVTEINGYIENLLDGIAGDLTQKQREYLSDMKEIGEENYRLLSDLLSMSKIERGIMTVNLQPVEIGQIIDFSTRDYETQIQKKGLDLRLEITSPELMVLADQDKTVEVIRNILNNAVKCTDRGSITIRAGEDKGFALLQVIDTGIGMSETTLQRLFTKDRAMGVEAHRAGAGLGLYIAKSFMQLQKGDISVVSELGKGSTFSVKIPKV